MLKHLQCMHVGQCMCRRTTANIPPILKSFHTWCPHGNSKTNFQWAYLDANLSQRTQCISLKIRHFEDLYNYWKLFLSAVFPYSLVVFSKKSKLVQVNPNSANVKCPFSAFVKWLQALPHIYTKKVGIYSLHPHHWHALLTSQFPSLVEKHIPTPSHLPGENAALM